MDGYYKEDEMKRLSNKSLLENERFLFWEKEKKLWLQNLSFRRAVKLEENLISSSLIWELRKNFFPDKPICLKDSLRKKT